MTDILITGPPIVSAQRFYIMSARLRIERNKYYETLEATQKGNLYITPCLASFLRVLDQASADAETLLNVVLCKARFRERHSADGIHERQRHILNRLLDGFEGKLTSSKYAKLAKCSQDTALRDIDDLLTRGILVRDPAGGRSTSYSLDPE